MDGPEAPAICVPPVKVHSTGTTGDRDHRLNFLFCFSSRLMTMRDRAALRFWACVALSVVLLVAPLVHFTSYQSVHQYIDGY
jgi:hypothetical protein